MTRTTMLLVFTMFSLGALASCAGGTERCDAKSCSGCCTTSGLCDSGGSANACGSNGNLCSPCSNGQTCVIGLCVSSGSNVGGGAGGAGGGRSSGGGGGGGTNGDSAPRCSTSDDCPTWYCDCQSGPPVNSRRCINNVCQSGAQSCGSACAGFGTCWVGTSSGGFSGGSNAGPSTCSGGGGGSAGGGGGASQTCGFSDLGDGCAQGSECQSGLCYGTSPSYLCTKGCASANDCPRGWACETVSGGGRVCMTGTSTTPRSSSNVCSSVTFNDLGAPCGHCSSGFCTSNMCTRRCDSSADCPSTWRCITGTSFNYCGP